MTDPKLQMARRVAAAAYVGSDAWHDGLRTEILTGNCDDGPVVIAVLAAIEECTERAAKLADVVSSIHVERRDDGLHEGNHLGALTQARNAQTADHIALALRSGDHLKGPTR